LELPEAKIEHFLQECANNLESYESACQTIDQWRKDNPGELILQALACGVIAAAFGGWLAWMGGLK
jgi:hypothetical protein